MESKEEMLYLAVSNGDHEMSMELISQSEVDLALLTYFH